MHLEGRIYIQYGGLDISVEEYFFLVVSNWFLCTDAANDETRIFLCCFVIPPNNSSDMPECVSNVHHLYQLTDFLVVVALAMPLVPLSLPLSIISRR